MKDRLCGLMDGEQPRDDALFDALKRDRALRDCWRQYHLIGDALKGESVLDRDITARVMAALDDEPIVLAPRKPVRRELQGSVLALAATLAGVAVVGWIALAPAQAPKAVVPVVHSETAAAQPVSARTNAVPPVRQASREMQEYLIAHQTQLSTLQFRGGTEYIRTVAANRATPAK